MVGSLEKKILKDIYTSSKGLQDKTVASRFNLKVSYLMDFIDKFEKKDFISYDGLKIKIERDGIEYLFKNKLVKLNQDKYENIPSYMIGEKIEVNQPYIPSLDSLNVEELRISDESHN